MSALADLYGQAGPVMIPIVILSVVLYTRCFGLLLWLRRERLRLAPAGGRAPQRNLRRQEEEWQSAFRQQRLNLDALIAAAPLLGLLGTVSGLVTTFENLSGGGEKSMAGLARGISEVLVATESGLAVAIPATLLVYFAHRALRRNLQRLHELEDLAGEGPRP